MNSIKAVLFDLDNTLYENDEELEEWALITANQLLSPSQMTALMSLLPEISEHNRRSDGCNGSTDDDCTVLLNRLAPDLTTAAIEFIAAMQTNWLANMRLTPDALELLNALDANYISYGIITNAPPSQRIKTTILGLEARSNCIFISSEFGVDKPDPSIFQAAAECIGVTCDQILFVGDSPENDITGAHNAGMKAAWLRRGREWPEGLSTHEPEYVIDGLVEVVGIVSRET